jgi:hypothetical protein
MMVAKLMMDEEKKTSKGFNCHLLDCNVAPADILHTSKHQSTSRYVMRFTDILNKNFNFVEILGHWGMQSSLPSKNQISWSYILGSNVSNKAASSDMCSIINGAHTGSQWNPFSMVYELYYCTQIIFLSIML